MTWPERRRARGLPGIIFLLPAYTSAKRGERIVKYKQYQTQGADAAGKKPAKGRVRRK